MKRKRLSWILLLLLAGSLGGCHYIMYVLAPPMPPKKVPAEFKGLTGKRVAIVVYTDQNVQYEYPYARVDLSSVLAVELKKHVKKVTVVPPRRVVQYQDENIHWDSLDKTQLGRELGADSVLFVALDEYTMREPGSVNLYRGRITGQASVYETNRPEEEARVWCGDNFRALYPEYAPTGRLGQDDRKIRYETEKHFAAMVVKKFYKHEVPVE